MFNTRPIATLSWASRIVRRWSGVGLVLALVAVAAAAEPSREIQTAHLRIPANDGVLLEGFYALPAGKPPEMGWPVIVHLHGYSRGQNPGIAEGWARKGYLGIVYSSRGNGASEGYNTFGWREALDVRDVITYAIEELPSRSDRIGVTGGSFGGFRSYFAALVDKRIRTICPSAFPANGPDAFVPNDVFTAFTFYYRKARDSVRALGFTVALQKGLSIPEVRALTDLRSIEWFAREIECPVFVHLGVLDVIAPANRTIRFWEKLRVPKKLVLSSGGHGARGDPRDQARVAALRERWLAHWLKDEDTGILEEPGVYYAVRPTWSPEAADSFPPRPAPPPRRYYLSGPSSGRSAFLATTPGDPAGFELSNRVLRPGFDVQAASRLEFREVEGAVSRDIHVFETGPLEESLTLLGNVRLRLAVESASPVWQVYAAVFDVGPEGASELVTMAPFGKPEAGGGVARIEFELRSMAYEFAAGHRLRLELSNHGEPIFVPYFEDFSVTVKAGPESWMEIPVQ